MFSLFSPLTGKTENVLCEFYFHSLCGEHLVEGEATPSMIIVLLFELFFFSVFLSFICCVLPLQYNDIFSRPDTTLCAPGCAPPVQMLSIGFNSAGSLRAVLRL